MDVPGSPLEPVFDSAVKVISRATSSGFQQDHQHLPVPQDSGRRRRGVKPFSETLPENSDNAEEVIGFRYYIVPSVFAWQAQYLPMLHLGQHRVLPSRHRTACRQGGSRCICDRSLQLGLTSGSSVLGDPTARGHDGSPQAEVRRPKNEADIVRDPRRGSTPASSTISLIVEGPRQCGVARVDLRRMRRDIVGRLAWDEDFGFKGRCCSRVCAARSRLRRVTSSRRRYF